MRKVVTLLFWIFFDQKLKTISNEESSSDFLLMSVVISSIVVGQQFEEISFNVSLR
jgi:hypothetical protein